MSTLKMMSGSWLLTALCWIATGSLLGLTDGVYSLEEWNLVFVNESDLDSLGENGTNRTTYFAYPNPIHYRDPEVKRSYRSSDAFDAKGMQPVYFLADLFLDVIQLGNLPSDFFDNATFDTVLDVISSKRQELLVHSSGLLAITVFGLFLAVAFPIAGLIFCACRCVGKCGGRPAPCEKKYDPCKRVSLGLILSALVIIITFGIVCAFVTNEYIEENVELLPKNVNEGLDDVSLYLNNTKMEVQNLLVNNFQQLATTLDIILDQCGSIIQTHLTDVSKALAVENLTNIVSGLATVQQDLNDIITHTTSLQTLGRKLDRDLTSSRKALSGLLQRCLATAGDVCRVVSNSYNINDLRVKSDFSMLPDVTQVAEEISLLIRDNIEGEVRKGKESLDGISRQIQNAINNTIPKIKVSIHEVGLDLERSSKKICDNIAHEGQLTGMRRYTSVGAGYLQEYAIIRYYASLAICLVILLITVLFAIGLFYGFCGRKPNYLYGDESCSKATGARFIMLGVYLIFVFYIFLMLFTTALILVGGLTSRIVCEPIVKDPSSSQLLKLIDSSAKTYKAQNMFRRHLSITDMIRRCHLNESAYSVFNVEPDVNIDAVTNYRQRYNVKDKIQELVGRISLNPSITILTPQAKSQLQRLADSKISDVNFTSFDMLLSLEVVHANFTQLMTILNRTISDTKRTVPSIAAELEQEVRILQVIQNQAVEKMERQMGELRNKLKDLQRDIMFNKSSFREGVHHLIQQAEKAQYFIQNKGQNEVISLARKLTSNFTSYLDEYANRVNYQVKHNVGKCWPVSHAINATVISVCHSVGKPLNGFWASVGWCLMLLIPCIFLAVNLSMLYQKSDLKALPSNESHGGKKRKRKSQLTYDNQNGYIHDASPGYSASRQEFAPPLVPRSGGYYPAITYDYSGSGEGYELDDPHTFRNIPVKPHSPTSRAPLQEWEFQSEAPPQYNSATNLTAPDIDRPPPYYFPGPSS